jgi:hypothetical protein
MRCTDLSKLAAQLVIVEPESWRLSSRYDPLGGVPPIAGIGAVPTGFEHSLITSGADLAASHQAPEIRPSSGFRAA